MPCNVVKHIGPSGDVVTAIVCTKGGRTRKLCSVCRQAEGTKLCDFKLPAKRTCDAPLCWRCAVAVGPDLDHCPTHPEREQQLTAGGDER